MDAKMKLEMKQMIHSQLRHSFLPEYQKDIPESDALGVLISHYFEWDGIAILETFLSALEDANFHSFSGIVTGWLEDLKKS